MNEETRSRLRSWSINAALVAASLAVAFLLAEVTLRLIGFSNPVLWTYDDVTGRRLYAGAEGWFRREGEAYIKINSAGLRDREHAPSKPPDTIRIAVLGDSMTEALQVPLESTYWAVLERELKRCGRFTSKQIEVINFGVSGYGTAQELLTFRNRAAAMSPDVTILGFYPGNDVRNNSKELETDKLRPFFDLRGTELVADNSFLVGSEYQSYKASFEARRRFFGLRTLQLIRQLKSALEQRAAAQAAGQKGVDLELGLDDSALAAPRAESWSRAWQLTERLIVALRDEVDASGSRLIVVSIPIGIQAHPDAAARDRFMRKLGVGDLWYPDRRMREFATREGVDVVTLGQTFQSHAERNRAYLYGFENSGVGTGHLNENGHRLIGEALARHLCQGQ